MESKPTTSAIQVPRSSARAIGPGGGQFRVPGNRRPAFRTTRPQSVPTPAESEPPPRPLPAPPGKPQSPPGSAPEPPPSSTQPPRNPASPAHVPHSSKGLVQSRRRISSRPLLQASLLEDTVPGSLRNKEAWFPGRLHNPWLVRVPEDSVASSCSCLSPPVLLQDPNGLSNRWHASELLRSAREAWPRIELSLW